MNHHLVAVILAAGKGTRMKSRLPKAAHRLCGKAMARYPVDAVRAAIGDDVEYVLQAEQRGTGHAVLQAERALREADDAPILNGDLTLVTADDLRLLLERHRATGASAT